MPSVRVGGGLGSLRLLRLFCARHVRPCIRQALASNLTRQLCPSPRYVHRILPLVTRHDTVYTYETRRADATPDPGDNAASNHLRTTFILLFTVSDLILHSITIGTFFLHNFVGLVVFDLRAIQLPANGNGCAQMARRSLHPLIG